MNKIAFGREWWMTKITQNEVELTKYLRSHHFLVISRLRTKYDDLRVVPFSWNLCSRDIPSMVQKHFEIRGEKHMGEKHTRARKKFQPNRYFEISEFEWTRVYCNSVWWRSGLCKSNAAQTSLQSKALEAILLLRVCLSWAAAFSDMVCFYN